MEVASAELSEELLWVAEAVVEAEPEMVLVELKELMAEAVSALEAVLVASSRVIVP